jgi:hypothetical protein
MKGFIYIAGSFRTVRRTACGGDASWIDNDPHFWTQPPTWAFVETTFDEKLQRAIIYFSCYREKLSNRSASSLTYASKKKSATTMRLNAATYEASEWATNVQMEISSLIGLEDIINMTPDLTNTCLRESRANMSLTTACTLAFCLKQKLEDLHRSFCVCFGDYLVVRLQGRLIISRAMVGSSQPSKFN